MQRSKRGMLGAIAIAGAMVAIALAQASSGLFASFSAPSTPVTAALQGTATAFLVVAGGGAPSYNEIALEKNVHYFQRTLAHLGGEPTEATILFANGNDGQATVRYLDPLGQERFKVPDIDPLAGAADAPTVTTWLTEYPQTPAGTERCPAFVYFTGHGALNEGDSDNNALILWGEELLSVRDLAHLLDQWPSEIPFVTMMAQCYAGAFANLIYEEGDPSQPVALQSRCGFFATVKTRPSVGCTPLVNEADYRDYSSSFFAGLSGRDRVGNPVPSADYDNNGTVSFAEAHAFAKVDEATPDWPISTAEAWLQRQATTADENRILGTPMATLAAASRPEQRYVVTALAAKLGYDLAAAFAAGPVPQARWWGTPQEVLTAYHQRLRMELINIGMEQQLRTQGDTLAIATLEQILACEGGTWSAPAPTLTP